jgi:hypothetical protein
MGNLLRLEEQTGLQFLMPNWGDRNPQFLVSQCRAKNLENVWEIVTRIYEFVLLRARLAILERSSIMKYTEYLLHWNFYTRI